MEFRFSITNPVRSVCPALLSSLLSPTGAFSINPSYPRDCHFSGVVIFSTYFPPLATELRSWGLISSLKYNDIQPQSDLDTSRKDHILHPFHLISRTIATTNMITKRIRTATHTLSTPAKPVPALAAPATRPAAVELLEPARAGTAVRRGETPARRARVAVVHALRGVEVQVRARRLHRRGTGVAWVL